MFLWLHHHPKEKVYCQDCQYALGYCPACTHPSCFADSYFKPNDRRIDDCPNKNRLNNCPDYLASTKKED